MSALLLNTLSLNGGPYWIGRDFDPGSGKVDTVSVESVLFDGDVISGSRTGNRTISVPVVIIGVSATDRAAKLNAIHRIVERAAFTMTFTPTGGLPVVWDCSRGEVRVERNLVREQAHVVLCTIVVPAQPFGRNPMPVVTTTVMNGADPSGAIVDECDSTTSTGPNATPPSVAVTRNGVVDNTFFVTGGASIRTTSTQTDTNAVLITTASTTRTSGTWDFSGYGYLNFVIAGSAVLSSSTTEQGYDGDCSFILQDSNGRQAAWTLTPTLTPSGLRYSIDLTMPTAVNGGFNRSQITAYYVQAKRAGSGTGSTWTFRIWVDDVHGSATGGSSSARILRLLQLPGTARTPVELEVTLPGDSAANGLLIAPWSGQPLGFSPVLTNTTGTGTSFTYTKRCGDYTPGGFALYARVFCSTTSTVTMQAFSRVTSRSVPATVPGSTATRLVYLGELVLPPQNVLDASASTTFSVTITSTNSVTIYEVFTVPVDSEGVVHALAAVQEGSVTTIAPASGVLVLPAPDSANQRGLFGGASRAQATALDDSLAAFTGGGLYLPQANYTDVLVVVQGTSGGALVSTVKSTAYPRWHTEREQ